MCISKYENKVKKGLSLALAFALILSLFAGLPGLQQPARAASASDYTSLGVIYSATARVDESIGLRANVSITGSGSTVTGITPMDTRLYSTRGASLNATSSSTLDITVTPYANYTLNRVVVAAIATITHPAPSGYTSGTKDAVKDITTIPGPVVSAYTYTVPNFTAYVKSGDMIAVEIVVYADLTYDVAPAYDYVINLGASSASAAITVNGSAPSNGVVASGNVIQINTQYAYDRTVRIYGTAINTYFIEVRNGDKGTTTGESHRRVDIVLDNAQILRSAALYPLSMDSSSVNYYKTRMTGDGATYTQPGLGVEAASSLTRWTGTTNRTVYAPMSIIDADVYLTVAGTGENALVQASTVNSSEMRKSGIFVDASASLIITDASADNELFVRGGGCSAAIGSTGTQPCGYIEIDGGDITTYSVYTSHCYAGIGNGGHYDNADPGIRGIVINGGKVNAFGFHYGIGGNGGTYAGVINTTVGEQYIVITGGDVITEASAGAAGAALGFAYNNARHDIRIGRPDKSDSDLSLFAVNWGFGAAISGKMTFYSGTTSAYSGQYAAAIGGNAISAAATTDNPARPTSPTSAVNGTPLTVYGGNVTAVAGAFEQGTGMSGTVGYYTTGGSGALGTADYSGFRGGTTANPRNSAAAVIPETRAVNSYGAAIGGALTRAGGSLNNIFAGTFNVTSSVYGAGIGGGGAYSSSQTGGAGGDTWIGNLYDLATGNIAPMSFTVTSGTYGAGIGGGGSSTGSAGSGGNLYIGGGSFDITSGTYGAGIGGGGTNATSGAGGSGGNVVISGDTFGGIDIKSGLFGAGIGGGGSISGAGGSGGNLYIDCKTDASIIARWNGGSITPSDYNFTVSSGQFGAGIGGGGSASGNGGAGANLLTIKGGNFGITAGGNAAAYDTTLYGYYSLGAGIGGGGSYIGTGGDGPVTAIISGGYFNVFSQGYGAAIGGGGTLAGYVSLTPYPAGRGGTATYTGGTVVVQVLMNPVTGESLLGSVGMGGGHNPYEPASGDFPYSRTTNGEVTILGGNISTEITSVVGGDETQHAWTLPTPGKNSPASAGTSTTSAIKIITGKDLIGDKVGQVSFIYSDTPGTPGTTYYIYGVDDLYITEGRDGANIVGVAWIWVPSYLVLKYDLTSGVAAGSYSSAVLDGNLNDFDIKFATRQAVGQAKLYMASDSAVKEYDGEQKTLLKWNEEIESSLSYDGATWIAVSGAMHFHVADYDSIGVLRGNYLYELAEHAPGPLTAPNPNNSNNIEPVPVYLIGWTDTVGHTAIGSGASEHIYQKNEPSWNYTQYLIKGNTVAFSNQNITVYAVWGYDTNFNGVPDVYEDEFHLIYNANVPPIPPISITVPVNHVDYSTGAYARLATEIPTGRPGYVFVAWSSAPESDLGINAPCLKSVVGGTTYVDLSPSVPSDLYLGALSPATTGTRSFSYGGTDYGTIEAPASVSIGGSNRILYAVWAVDSNGNSVPDFLEPKRALIHIADHYKTLDQAHDVPATITYVDGNIGATVDSVLWPQMMSYEYSGTRYHDFPANTRPVYIFMGWTENSTLPEYVLPRSFSGTLPADLADPLTLAAAFNGSDKTVYAIWAEDLNDNGIPDYQENALSFLYETQTIDPVDGIPSDSTHYYDTDPINVSNNANLYHFDITNIKAPKPASPYMERDGWVFLGWVASDAEPDYNFTEAQAEAYKTVNFDYPDVDITFLTSVSGLGPNGNGTFKDDNIHIYAVWGEDTNNNGVPDWYDEAGRYVQYVPNLSGITVNNMPGTHYTATTGPIYTSSAAGVYIDDKGVYGGGYTTNETALIDYSSVPTASGYVFLGWTPVYFLGTNFVVTNKTAFYHQVAGLEDILTWDDSGGGMPTANNVSGYNQVASSSLNPFYPSPVPYAPVQYTLTPGLEAAYATAVASGLPNGYNTFNWFNNFTPGMGFPNSVTFDAFDYPDMDVVGGSGGFVWQLWAVWAVDANGNGIADMFEETYSLFYSKGGGTGGPADQIDTYMPGQVATFGTAKPARNHPVTGNSLIFLGWTAADQVKVGEVIYPIKDYYSYGDYAILPPMGSGVTFADYDITVYAVWAEDEKPRDGTPDVYGAGVKLTYDANGGTNPPAAVTYDYNATATVAGQGSMIFTGHPFLRWNTAKDGSGTSYVSGATFTITTDVTLYAQWQYTVTYDANNGTGTVPTDATAYNYGDIVTVLFTPAPTKTDSTFLGWSTSASTTAAQYKSGGTTSFSITANTTLYAIWQTTSQNTYTVTYHANGSGGAAPAASTGNALNAIITLPGPGSMTPPSGYTTTFRGWNTLANGTGTLYSPNSSYTVTGNVTLYAVWQSSGGNNNPNPSGPTGGGPSSPGRYTLTFQSNGGTQVASITADAGTVISLAPYTSLRNGYKFEGWCSDAATTILVTSVTLNNNMTVYAKWSLSIIPDQFLPYPHYCYIIGYPDGTVRPSANITRAEVATIFFRLLTDKVRDENYTTVNSFSDVDSSAWYNTAVSTLVKMGMINGRDDGRFDGEATITRAEFAALAARFLSDSYTGANQFTDTDGHWAQELISRAANKGWILGENGMFRPNDRITRAEAMTLVNRMLQRQPENITDLQPGMRTFTDNMETSAWYYLAVQEATNSHEFNRKADGLYESWTNLISDPDWKAYER